MSYAVYFSFCYFIIQVLIPGLEPLASAVHNLVLRSLNTFARTLAIGYWTPRQSHYHFLLRYLKTQGSAYHLHVVYTKWDVSECVWALRSHKVNNKCVWSITEFILHLSNRQPLSRCSCAILA